MKPKITGVLVLLCLLGNLNSFSQIKPQTIRVSFYNEAISLPTFKLIRKPVHPAITFGTDLWIKSGKHWQKSLGADLTYYHHRLSENTILVDAIYSLGYKFNFGLQTKLITGIGYKHSFLPGEVYKFENGEYKKATNWGTAHVNAKLGFGLEFPINEKFSVTADYKFMIAAPYSEQLKFSAHTFIGLGLKINLPSNPINDAGKLSKSNY